MTHIRYVLLYNLANSHGEPRPTQVVVSGGLILGLHDEFGWDRRRLGECLQLDPVDRVPQHDAAEIKPSANANREIRTTLYPWKQISALNILKPPVQ